MSNARPPKNPTLADIDAVTAPTTLVIQMCVAGDLFLEHQQLCDQQDAKIDELANSDETPKLNDSHDAKEHPEVVKIAKRIQALEAKMAQRTFDFTFQKLPDDQWDDLFGEHAPRKGNKRDERYAVNMSVFPRIAVQKSCISPDMSGEAAFAAFWGKLNTGQKDHLYFQGAWAVNNGGLVAPKSVTASAVIHSSKLNSTTASRSGSRTPSSSAAS